MGQSRRLREVQSPIIPVVGELIRQNAGTISLGQGVVSYGPPREAIDAYASFLADPENHKYQAVHGIPSLLEAIATKLRADNGIRPDEHSRVVVTAGGNMGFMNAVLAIADPGDEFILLAPYYFNHEMAIGMADCRAVVVPTDETYQPRLDEIERAITPRTRAVVTISPNNPSGAVYSEQSLRSINSLCGKHGIYHINDEAYETFTYDGARHFSPGSIKGASGHTISLFSLSKAYGFASWRIGYMLIPEDLFDAVRKIQDTILICPPVVSQVAAAAALGVGSSYCRERLAAIEQVRRIVAGRLRELGDLATLPRSDGAFYFLLKVNVRLGSMQMVERLIREHKVAVIPGTTFGLNDGCFLRIAYGALTGKTAEEGIERLVKGIGRIATAG